MNKNRIKSRGLSNLQSAGKDLQEKINDYKFSEENNISFSFKLEKKLIMFIKELVLSKISESVEYYNYNESSAVREGISLLRKSKPLEQRPDEIINPTKRGRKSTLGPGIIKLNTSFLISEADREYIYNFIYHQQKGGGRFTKEEFFCELVKELSSKYNIDVNA